MPILDLGFRGTISRPLPSSVTPRGGTRIASGPRDATLCAERRGAEAATGSGGCLAGMLPPGGVIGLIGLLPIFRPPIVKNPGSFGGSAHFPGGKLLRGLTWVRRAAEGRRGLEWAVEFPTTLLL